MHLWAYQNGVKIDFSRPGKPTDNAFVESFNGTFRDACLNVHWFETLPRASVSLALKLRTLPRRNSSLKAGEENTIIVALTGLSKIGCQANSPVSTRLAAYSLQPKTVED